MPFALCSNFVWLTHPESGKIWNGFKEMITKQLNKPYRKGVNAIILDKDNNFLIIQKKIYKENEWNFLGGGREEGETLEQNLFRELKEELDTDPDDFEIIGISPRKTKYDYPPELASKIYGGKYRGQAFEQVALRFVGDKKKLVFTPKEFRTHKWVKASELVNYLVFPNQYRDYKRIIDELLPRFFNSQLNAKR